MRYALLRLTQQQLQEFINIAGIEMQGIYIFRRVLKQNY